MYHETIAREGPRANSSVDDFNYRMLLDERVTRFHSLINNTFDVMAFAYAQDMPHYADFAADSLLVRIPHFFHRRRYENINEEAITSAGRETDVLVVGALDKIMYPLRTRIANLIYNGRLKGTVYKHPGYFTMLPDNSIAKQAINVTFLEKQANAYANAMQHAKIVVCTQSLRKLPLRKYIEAAMAGALVVGDLPPELLQDLSRYVVEINNNMSDEELLGVFEKWLSNEKARTERAMIGHKIVLNKYSSASALEQLVRSMKEFKNGRRGMVSAETFLLTAAPQ